MKIDDIKHALKRGEVVVMPTDTVYGLVALASVPEVVESIYKIKQRQSTKPPTLIIGSVDQLIQLGIDISVYKDHISKLWPGSNSLVMSCPYEKFTYLHRGKFSLAVRLPELGWLRQLAVQVGPLATSSANPEGKPTAKNVTEARQYFDSKVKYFFDGGTLTNHASTIIDLTKKSPKVIRK